MPIGCPVLGRVTKAEQIKDDKRFHFSLKKATVVYGLNAIDRQSIQEGQELDTIILTLIPEKQKAFAQIKGSFLKLKVKNVNPKQVKEGDIVQA
jgi:hypothetical protein